MRIQVNKFRTGKTDKIWVFVLSHDFINHPFKISGLENNHRKSTNYQCSICKKKFLPFLYIQGKRCFGPKWSDSQPQCSRSCFTFRPSQDWNGIRPLPSCNGLLPGWYLVFILRLLCKITYRSEKLFDMFWDLRTNENVILGRKKRKSEQRSQKHDTARSGTYLSSKWKKLQTPRPQRFNHSFSPQILLSQELLTFPVALNRVSFFSEASCRRLQEICFLSDAETLSWAMTEGKRAQ